MQRVDSVEKRNDQRERRFAARREHWPVRIGSCRASPDTCTTAIFINTRGLGSYPDDVCPLGARRVELAGMPRVASAYVWGSGEPTVLALHGWGTDSTTMSAVVEAAVASGESAICFDAPGHGVSPGSQATITEYAQATLASTATLSEHSHDRRPFARIDRRSLGGRGVRRDRTCSVCFCSLQHARCRA